MRGRIYSWNWWGGRLDTEMTKKLWRQTEKYDFLRHFPPLKLSGFKIFYFVSQVLWSLNKQGPSWPISEKTSFSLRKKKKNLNLSSFHFLDNWTLKKGKGQRKKGKRRSLREREKAYNCPCPEGKQSLSLLVFLPLATSGANISDFWAPFFLVFLPATKSQTEKKTSLAKKAEKISYSRQKKAWHSCINLVETKKWLSRDTKTILFGCSISGEQIWDQPWKGRKRKKPNLILRMSWRPCSSALECVAFARSLHGWPFFGATAFKPGLRTLGDIFHSS